MEIVERKSERIVNKVMKKDVMDLLNKIGYRADAIKTLPKKELLKRVEISSQIMIKKNKQAYEALAYR